MMSILTLFKSQREFIRNVIEKKPLFPAIIIGVLGVYSFPIASFLGRIALGTTVKNEVFMMLVADPIKSILYFVLSVGLVYLIARLFRGENRFIEYVIASGFGGIYAFLVSLTLAPISFLSKISMQNGQANQSILLLAVLLVITTIIVAFYAVKYSVISISEVFKLKVMKSIIVWLITFIPLFILTGDMWKINQ